MLKKSTFLKLLILSLLLQSCEDVINVNLKNTTPRLVVEGSISNLSDSVRIMLHKSTDYFKPIDFAPVANATVSINDSYGNTYVLFNNSNGTYSIKGIHSFPDDQFTLNITSDGELYEATTQMPNLVKIDSVIIEKSIQHFNKSRIKISILIKDPAGVANFYQVKVFKNDSLLNATRLALYSDRYFDGKSTKIDVTSRRFGTPRFEVNDIVKIQLINIDKMMYDYFQVLRDNTDSENILSASTPSNPPNNITNGALGYFAAWSISEKTVIIK